MAGLFLCGPLSDWFNRTEVECDDPYRRRSTLVAVPSVYDFKGVGGCNAIIYADKQKNIGIGGKGIIDGRSMLCGQVWKSNCRKAISKEMYPVMHRL